MLGSVTGALPYEPREESTIELRRLLASLSRRAGQGAVAPADAERASAGGNRRNTALGDGLALEDGDHRHSYHSIDIWRPPYYYQEPVGGERSPVSDRGGTAHGRRRLFIFASFLGIIASALIVQLVRLTVVLPSQEGGDSLVLPEVQRGSILDRQGRILAVTVRKSP